MSSLSSSPIFWPERDECFFLSLLTSPLLGLVSGHASSDCSSCPRCRPQGLVTRHPLPSSSFGLVVGLAWHWWHSFRLLPWFSLGLPSDFCYIFHFNRMVSFLPASSFKENLPSRRPWLSIKNNRKESAASMPPCLLTGGLIPGPRWTPHPRLCPCLCCGPMRTWQRASAQGLRTLGDPTALLSAVGKQSQQRLPSQLGTCGWASSGATMLGTTSFNSRSQSRASGSTS